MTAIMVNGLVWRPLDSRAEGRFRDVVGYLPDFLHDDDPRGAREQFAERYVHGGWRPQGKFTLKPKTFVLKYPGDPPFSPLFKTQLRDEVVLVYPHAYVAVVQPDGAFEVCRMD